MEAHPLLRANFFEPECICNSEGDIYLMRYVVWRDDADNALFIHVLYRSDEDREMHDHPADFKARIISGSYRELTPDGEQVFGVGDWNIKKAEDLHRLEVIKGPVVTLFYRYPKRRDWGFMLPEGWMSHSKFLEEKYGKGSHAS